MLITLPHNTLKFQNLCFIYLFFKFYFIFKLYIIVLVLPNIKMNPPQVGREEGGGFRIFALESPTQLENM